MYLIFHIMFFTARLYSVMRGSPTLFTDYPGALPVSEQEIAWAVLLAELGLIGMTGGLILSSQRDRRRTTHLSGVADQHDAVLSERVLRSVSLCAFPLGVVSLLVAGAIPKAENLAVDFGEWGTSGWLMVTQFWPVLVLLALIYFYGFRRGLVVLIAICLALMSIQGFNRFRVILPVIFLLITWQTRTGFKWPRKWMIISFAFFAMLTFPMKQLGRMVQRGESLSDMVSVASDSFSEVLRGTAPDQMFLDQFAATVWLVDDSGRHFYGQTLYPLLFLPVPRQLWPDKPNFSFYLYETRNPARPIYWCGMGGTIHGESYANFGLIGVPIVSFILGYWLGNFYFTAMRRSYFSVYRFMYVTVACCLVQVFRDGLNALVLFPVVNMMPLVAIAALSYVSYRRKRAWNPRYPSFVPGR